MCYTDTLLTHCTIDVTWSHHHQDINREMSSSGGSAPNSCTWWVHSSLTGAEVYIPLYIYTHVSALEMSRVRWRWSWKFGGWARKRMKDSKSTRNRNMKESIIVHGDLGLMFSWCLLFLRLLGSPSLSLWLAKSMLIRSKEIYLLDGVGVHYAGCKQARGRMRERDWEQWPVGN